jgi:MFS family permease
MWTWISLFMIAAARETAIDSAASIDGITFLIIASGAIGCVVGGQVADRMGREWWVSMAMAVSGACCVLIGFCLGVSFWLCTAVAIVWGFFVVADSAQFSTMVTEVCPRHAVGTALTLQTSIGFLLTTVSIQLVPVFQERVGWQFAFAFLALGPAAGIAAIRKLARIRRDNPLGNGSRYWEA